MRSRRSTRWSRRSSTMTGRPCARSSETCCSRWSSTPASRRSTRTSRSGWREVAAGVAAKLRHRHPHVFGDAVVADAEDVHRRWEEIKKAEKARASVLDGIPAGLPALARAQKVLGRARRAGLSVDDAHSLPSASEVTGGTGVAGVHDPGDASGLGRALLEIAVAAEAAGVDAEAALRTAVRDLEAALRRAEAADDRD